jgi:peptidoglycan hydrolase FlgJ
MQLPPITADTPRDAILRSKAIELEATFLSEMLSYTGIDAQSESFSGGHGEEQFTSFLRQEHAKGIVAAGGIGLAEQIFQSLTARAGHAD